MKTNFSAYTKKEFIEMIENNMKESDVIIFTTALSAAATGVKLKLSNLTFQFPHEMLAQPDNVLHFIEGNLTASVVIMRKPKEQLSKMYLDGLKEHKGVFGFTIDQ